MTRRTFWICGLLLLASTINYMDRQVLSNVSVRITTEFGLSEEEYGDLEFAFGLAFAFGSLVFGFLADKVDVRRLYPFVLLAWSATGFATGFAQGYVSFLICRTLLGFFEAGHWPCALRTTRLLLPPEGRTLGNSLLQSGTALGAIVTPLIVKSMLTDQPGSWRPAFQVIGVVGVAWAALWWISVRAGAARDAEAAEESSNSAFRDVLRDRRFWVLIVVVIAINLNWHFFRVWLNKFLQKGRGYSESETLNFVFWFNVATDVGCIAAGLSTKWLFRKGWSVFHSRTLVFTVCCLATALTLTIPWLQKGPLLLGVLLVVGMGALGQFPCYYAYAQDLSKMHMGKVAGLLATVAWVAVSPLHKFFGRLVDQTGSYDTGLAIVGAIPAIGCAALWLAWRKPKAT